MRHLAGRIDAEGDRYARGQRGDAPRLLLADDLIGDKEHPAGRFRARTSASPVFAAATPQGFPACSCNLAMAGI